LEDIKNDVRVLRTYSGPAQAAPTPAASLSNAQLMQEMSQLKRLIYWTLASCSLMIAAVAGIWIRNLKKLPLREKIVRYLSGK
jgi:hypothetical protein